MENRKRKILAKRAVPNPKVCAFHLGECRRVAVADRNPDTNAPKVPKLELLQHTGIRKTTILTDTALVPLCNECFIGQAGHAIEVSRLEMDKCCCASDILEAECVYCDIGRIEQKKIGAISRRTRQTSIGLKVVVCQCGRLVPDVEHARKCMGCNGVVAAPFKDCAGRKINFKPHSAKVVQEPTMPPREDLFDLEAPNWDLWDPEYPVTGTFIPSQNDPMLALEALDEAKPSPHRGEKSSLPRQVIWSSREWLGRDHPSTFEVALDSGGLPGPDYAA